MQKLTKEDRDLIAGGQHTTLLPGPNVPEPPSIPTDPDDPSGGIAGDGNGGGGGGDGAGGGGAGNGDGGSESSQDKRPKYQHKTPGGIPFTTRALLNHEQVALASEILDYAQARGIRSDYAGILVRQAFYETSLGTNFRNPTHIGIFQYGPKTWAERHNDLNINSRSDQIKAMYRDVEGYGPRYSEKHNSGEIPWHISFEYYVELKHHGGTNFTDWNSPWIAEYQAAAANLGFNEW
ncbi:hypothetical protein [Luteibacter yeojuensis]|uniref:Uncharacterized protein n=1 Tax=Luteibacter yeojuensis TaxID=345309 RepID=A0A0F3KYL9_9GAMM|nr:hypothetical protein [Luteibacter yeojuensis]KJV36375.1 hypothetical protein VI08_05155 [Luteibacter yeojuensis]